MLSYTLDFHCLWKHKQDLGKALGLTLLVPLMVFLDQAKRAVILILNLVPESEKASGGLTLIKFWEVYMLGLGLSV